MALPTVVEPTTSFNQENALHCGDIFSFEGFFSQMIPACLKLTKKKKSICIFWINKGSFLYYLKNYNYLIFRFNVHGWVFCQHVYLYAMCLVPGEARRSYETFWNWSYRWVVSHYDAGARNLTQASRKSNWWSYPQRNLHYPFYFCRFKHQIPHYLNNWKMSNACSMLGGTNVD